MNSKKMSLNGRFKKKKSLPLNIQFLALYFFLASENNCRRLQTLDFRMENWREAIEMNKENHPQKRCHHSLQTGYFKAARILTVGIHLPCWEG